MNIHDIKMRDSVAEMQAELATVKAERDALREALTKIMKASNPPEGAAWYRAVARLALTKEGGEG